MMVIIKKKRNGLILLDYYINRKNGRESMNIKDVLNGLKKEQLIDIIEDVAKKDKMFNDSLVIKYSKGDSKTELKNCKKLINSIVRKYCGRDRFISYRQAYYFVNDMVMVLEKANNTNDMILAIDIALLILDEAMKSFQYADDSGGDIGMLVSETFRTIRSIIENNKDIDIKVQEKIFKKLLKKSEDTIFDGWSDFKTEMLRLCAEFAYIEKFREELIEKIKSQIQDDNDANYSMKYKNEKMLLILYEIIDEYGSEEESEAFARSNIKYSSFREILINKFAYVKNYDKVIELTFEGEKQDKEYPGLIHKWKKIRYDAYKNLLMKKEQMELGKELLIQGDFEYYEDLKGVSDNKKEFYDTLREELKKSKDWRSRDVLIKVIYVENDLNELMEYVRNNKTSIEEHAEKLKDEFYDEVIEIYEDYIKFEAERSSNRSHYKGVCAIIKRYKKIAGKDKAEEIINELKIKYRKKPAFIDELSRIK